MTDEEQAQIDRIERERRQHERDLLLLLLAVIATSRSHAVYAARSGNDAVAAARMVIKGDNGGHFIGVAPLVAQAQVSAYAAGMKRVGRIVDLKPLPRPDPRQLEIAANQYKVSADAYARELADRIGTGIRDVLDEALPPQEEVQAIRLVFRKGQLTRLEPGHLETDAETAICGAYGDGMLDGYGRLGVRHLVKGLRHESILDEGTTPICRQRHGVQLPLDHPYWQSNRVPLHWKCRSVIMPILKDFEPTPPEMMPTIPPMEGFGSGVLVAA